MMVFFLDASSLVKRYHAEPGTPLVDHLLDHVAADRLVVLNVGLAEAVSILVRKKHAGLLSGTTFAQALARVGQEMIHHANLRKIEATNSLVIAALVHIQTHSLNGTDAIALHAALGLAQYLRTRGDDLVLVASDQRLLRAAGAEGLVTFNPETQSQTALATLVGP
jgi:predicted nucleic acid-binding protein